MYSIAFVPVWLLAIAAEGGYDKRYLFIGSEEYRRLFHASAFAALGTALFTFLIKGDLSRSWMISTWIFGVLFLQIGRYAYRHRLHSIGRHMPPNKILIVGANKEAAELASVVNNATYLGGSVIGALDGSEKSDAGIKVIDRIQNLKKQISAIKPEAVIVVPSALGQSAPSVYEELKDLDCTVYFTPSLKDIVTSRVTIQPIGEIPLIRIEKVTIGGLPGFTKRAFDLLVAALLTILLLPVFLVIAIAIKLDSRGSIFFKQQRIGHRGHEFKLYKFRSMVEEAEFMIEDLKEANEASGHIFKLKNDPRVTKVGRILRRYSLDELPQLINVIQGKMSLVGPRPPLPMEVANYNAWENQRLGARPGMTGYWQIKGRAKDLFDFSDVVKMDLFYIENWSITLDLYILWKTLKVVVLAKGAY